MWTEVSLYYLATSVSHFAEFLHFLFSLPPSSSSWKNWLHLPLLPCSHLGGLPLPVHSWQWEALLTPVARLEKKGLLLTPVTFQSLGRGSFCLHWHPHLPSLGLISAALCVVGPPCSPNRPFLGVCESAGFWVFPSPWPLRLLLLTPPPFCACPAQGCLCSLAWAWTLFFFCTLRRCHPSQWPGCCPGLQPRSHVFISDFPPTYDSEMEDSVPLPQAPPPGSPVQGEEALSAPLSTKEEEVVLLTAPPPSIPRSSSLGNPLHSAPKFCSHSCLFYSLPIAKTLGQAPIASCLGCCCCLSLLISFSVSSQPFNLFLLILSLQTQCSFSSTNLISLCTLLLKILQWLLVACRIKV